MLTCAVAFAGAPKDEPAALAPSFRLPGRGAEVVSDSLRGRVVLVDFWASWCVPCRKSFPWLAALQEKHANAGLSVVGVNVDKSRGAADAFLAQVPAPFAIAFDPAGKVASAYRVKGMPSTFLVGRDGRVVYAHVGFDPAKTAEFEKRIEEELAR
ncbi:MAG: redoxin family protein [Candidatus Eisenbacteria bacterium]|uniref:Redoxin family protein n=1 Tax=Eiseniibacteriota bacterium TaxID=2212470 RepID=A0A933SG23_UNCEI|nr:redoxin family protein [Candidatus Eisenbacteria bacterium]